MSVDKACYVYRSASMQLYFHVHEADCGCSAQGCRCGVEVQIAGMKANRT